MVDKLTPPLVIYHGNCIDGFMAARVARLGIREDFGVEPELFPAGYGDSPPLEKVQKAPMVYVVDFSYPRRDLQQMHLACDGGILVLDHHVTAQTELEGLDFCRFDMGRSGAGLVWDHFFESCDRPWAVDYVEDRDLWRFALPQSEQINAYIGSIPKTPEDYDRLLHTPKSEAELVGGFIYRGVQDYVEQMIEGYARRLVFCGYKVYIVNCPHKNCSELVGELAKRAPSGLALGWSQRADGTFVFSVRSRGGFADGRARTVAESYGGGGHPNAAGFKTDTIPVFVHARGDSW